MTRQADAIIIGAGVIGAATAFELCKRGYKTLNIDKLPSRRATGRRATRARSCARTTPRARAWRWPTRASSTGRTGSATSARSTTMGTARYMQCGTVLLKSATGHHEKVLRHYRDLGVEYEEWDNATARREGPRLRHATPSGRPSAPTTRTSGTSRRASSTARSSPPARAT